MPVSIIILLFIGLGCILILQLVLLLRRVGTDLGPLVGQYVERVEARVRDEFLRNREEFQMGLRETREELGKGVTSANEVLVRSIQTLTEANEGRLNTIRNVVDERLQRLQETNSLKLDEMRKTVDEKLQSTLERRLGESFKQVSERLEAVSRGLGEMQSLASGVGDLKRMLTNVKSRGTFGEVQLAALLQDVLMPEQYETNVATKGGAERVEFAIRLPGKTDDENPVWLPIDAKFPIEDYQRLVDAEDRGEGEERELAAKQLELRLRGCARDICEKYLNPPATTDFGILFLPTEGLFAEVVRRPGLCDQLQRQYHVVVAGPTTLWSILNSLQMGFNTLKIQKHSSEVKNLLAAVKAEWAKYGDILDKVQKKLTEASDTIDKAQIRTRAIGRKLKDVEALPMVEAQTLLALTGDVDDEAE